jgi:DNA mismatch repair protein MutS2
LTIKNGRLVIPVLAEHKRKLKGIIHDQSNTGQTIFIEPADVFEMNNHISDLYNDKQREIIKVLTALTAELAQYASLIHQSQTAIGIIDFIRAKAQLAKYTESSKPILVKKPETRWVNARHPVLYINLKQQNASVVPLNIYLDEQERIVVISGPNAGGKSIALKTVGILQLMLQYGLLVPAHESSKVGIYQHVLGDIGDQQSIENDLSTYSAHLSNMAYFLKVAAQHTLFLIDEFGMGTDPQFGGPIAESIMLELNNHKARGVITTHFSNLKIRAGATQGFCNAAMLFDTQALNPTYIMQQGKPGSSYAYEIAQKMGIPNQVIQQAKGFSGSKENKVEVLLSDLEKEKYRIEQSRLEMLSKEQHIKALQADLEKQTDYIETHKKQLIKDAKMQAKHLIDSANKLIENTISEIKEAQAEKAKTKDIRTKFKKEIQHILPTQEHKIQIKAELEIGDWVGIEGTQSIGEIISMSKKSVSIRMGDLITTVDRKKCLKTQNPNQKADSKKSGNSQKIIAEAISEYSTVLDVRGKRADEALFELEKYLDRAIMLNIGKLEVLHGKGDRILKQAIHQYLRKFSGIKQFYFASEEFGGQGVTIVEFV